MLHFRYHKILVGRKNSKTECCFSLLWRTKWFFRCILNRACNYPNELSNHLSASDCQNTPAWARQYSKYRCTFFRFSEYQFQKLVRMGKFCVVWRCTFVVKENKNPQRKVLIDPSVSNYKKCKKCVLYCFNMGVLFCFHHVLLLTLAMRKQTFVWLWTKNQITIRF